MPPTLPRSMLRYAVWRFGYPWCALLLAVESVAARVSRARAAVWVPGRFSLLSTPTAADC